MRFLVAGASCPPSGGSPADGGGVPRTVPGASVPLPRRQRAASRVPCAAQRARRPPPGCTQRGPAFVAAGESGRHQVGLPRTVLVVARFDRPGCVAAD